MSTPRDYSHLGLPRTIPHFELGFVLEQIRPFWSQIPNKVEQSFVDAYSGGTDWTITKLDLDLLSDALWDILKVKLG